MKQVEHRFNEWVFHPDSRRLQKGKRVYRLPPQHALVLGELVAHAGRIVTRDRLIHLLWPARVVNFHPSLNAIIKSTRRMLSDSSRRPRYIETVHREGYRFVAAAPAFRQDPGAVRHHVAPVEVVHAAESQGGTLKRVITAAVELVSAEFGAIFLRVTNSKGVYEARFEIAGLPRSRFEKFPLPRATDIFDRTFRGEVIVSANISKDRRFRRDPPYYGTPPGHPTVISYMGVPVTTHDGQVIGAMFFGHGKAGRFGISEQKHALLLATVAADALAAPSRRGK